MTFRVGFALYRVQLMPPVTKPRGGFLRSLSRRLAGRAVDLAVPGLLDDAVARANGPLDFGDESFRVGLDALVRSADEDDLLHLQGRAALRETLVLALVTRLQVTDAHTRDPSLAMTPPRRPLVIAGLPRTGTTLLHRLLCQDPASLYLPLWLCLEPLPAPDEAEWHGPGGQRRERAAALVDAIAKRDPGLAAIHPMGVELAEECSQLFRPTFDTWQYFITTPLPSYLRWSLEQDHVPAYRFFRRTLQVLERALPGDGWVLKAPQHWEALPALLGTMPEATVVCTHREPAEVAASWCSLIAHLWRQKSPHVDERRLAALQLELLAHSTEKALAARASYPERIIDVRFADLVADPLAVVERLYAASGRALHDEARGRMQRYLADNPRGKHGAHRYTLEDFGLTRSDVDARFMRYRTVLGELAP